MSNNDDAAEALVALGLLILAIPVGAVVKGWAFIKLWGWFVVPAFGLPGVTMAQAIGIGALISLLTHQISECEKEEKSIIARTFSTCMGLILGPIVVVGFAWLVLKFAS